MSIGLRNLRYFISITVLMHLLCMPVVAQFITLPVFQIKTENQNNLQVIANTEIGSTALTANLLKKYVQNSTITNDDKRFIENINKKVSRLGIESSYGISYYYKPDSLKKKKNNWIFNFNVEQKNSIASIFSNDILRTLLNGNSSFIGNNNGLILSPTDFEQYKFQKVGLGILKDFSITKGESKLFFARVNFINGNAFKSLAMHNSTIYFADSTYAMSGNVNFEYLSSKRDRAYFANSGFGASIDVGYSFTSSNWKISALISDYGFINWKNVTQLKVDTAFNYAGYKIDFNRLLNDSNYKFSIDSLYNISSHKNEIDHRSILPHTIKLQSEYSWTNPKFKSSLDFTIKKQIAFKTRITLIQYYVLNNKHNIGLFAAGGGYTNIQYGIIYNRKNKGLNTSLSLLNPHSYFTKNSLLIAGLNILLTYSW